MNKNNLYRGAMNSEALYQTRQRQLRRLIQEQFLGKQNRFAQAVHRSETYVNRLLMDRSSEHVKNLGEKLARDFEDTLGLPKGWFDDPDAPSQEWRVGTEPGKARTYIDADRFIGRPQSYLRVPCRYFYYDDETGSVTFAEDRTGQAAVYPNGALAGRNAAGIVRYAVSDEKMVPTLYPGDQITVDTNDKEPAAGGVFAIQAGQTVALCRVTPRMSGYYVSTDNQAYPGETVSPMDMHRLNILGRVVWMSGRI